MVIVRSFVLSILLIFLSPSFILASEYNKFITAIDQKKWEEANKEASILKMPELKTLVTWLEISYSDTPNFYTVKDFIKKHPNWPKLDKIKEKIENSKFKDCKNDDLLQWFRTYPPKTITGKKKYLSLLKNGKFKTSYIKETWYKSNFSKSEQEEFLKLYGTFLTKDDHIKRMEHLLFNKQDIQASRLTPLLPAKLRKYYEDRIDLQKGKTTKYDLSFYKDIGGLYSIAHMYDKHNDEENLISILTMSSNIESINQYYFWSLKAKLVRTLIQNGDYSKAYLFASTHGHEGITAYTEAEWLAGWIALQFLNDPNLAIIHFKNMYSKVKMPISISRGAYWLGRSYEKLEDQKSAEYWYKIAGQYYTSFYGQLSLCKMNACEVKIPNDPEITNQDIEHFNNNIYVKYSIILQNSRYSCFVKNFIFMAIDNSKTIGEVTLITRLGFELEHHHLSVEAAKHAFSKNKLVINSNYPVVDIVYQDHNLDHSLVLALIRQESVFNYKAISSAGAMGLMQIMPHVAKETAANAKVAFNKEKLVLDPHFNSLLGTTHLEKLLNSYNNSYILSIAAYNAGDKATSQWIEKNGDPRYMTNIEEIIDWIEKISFYETRNYVQRVLEGKSVYYMLLNKTNKIPILEDLTKYSPNEEDIVAHSEGRK